MSKCIGCGINLQNEDKLALGYTPKLDNKYCERCFKTIHYNENITINNLNNEDIIMGINKLNAYTLFITDLANVNERLINLFKQIKNDKLLIINKIDLLPSNLDLSHIEENIKNAFNISNDILFISSKENINLDILSNIILSNKKVVLCGETSSGKSTIINKLLDINLTTSKYKNTTLDFIKLKYEDTIIYDSPGLLIDKNKLCVDKVDVINKIMKKEFVLSIGDLKLSLDGSVMIYSNNKKISSKKESIELNYHYDIDSKSDIEIESGFIYIKNKCHIDSNKELKIRKSIIGGK